MSPRARKISSTTKPTRYVALLRGINMLGHKPIRMEAVQNAFTHLGYQNVKTVSASGNVLFETPKRQTVLVNEIEDKLEKTFGHFV